jgi:hypothetical protein
MNRSYSKIRHIQESNQILEKRILSEQTSITESRLENIVFKYLDDKLEGAELKKGEFCDIVLIFPGKDFGLLGWKKRTQTWDDELWYYWNFISDIISMFSLDKSEALDIIVSYVKSRYDWNVSSDLVRVMYNQAPSIYSLFVGSVDDWYGPDDMEGMDDFLHI